MDLKNVLTVTCTAQTRLASGMDVNVLELQL